MAELTYNWKRFYRKLGGVLDLSDAGFLVDPDAEYGSALNPDVVPWDTLASIPCLILLGEPGIGKTKAIQSEVDRIKEVPEKSTGRVLNIDLHAFQTDQRLHDRVFASPTMNAWKTDGSRLYLFLDGMDECLMRIDNIASVLADEFSDLDRERLHLRLACRTAVWPRDFELKLQELWGNDNVGTFELAPLRRADVVEAARVHAVDPPESFIGEVISRNIVPLAIKPVTLEFLLKTRTRPGGMPATQTALYAEGCRILCEDRRPGRRPGKSSDELPADKRLVIASRIAAATMFCNRDAVWTDVDQGDVPLEDIRITDFVGREAGDEPGPSENQVFQTLDTGLFSSRGIPRIGWAHQTYCEYLAARFLVDGTQSVDTMMSLLLHPDGKVIPQLRETAAWVAALVPEAFQRITSADPMTLLNSEATTGDPNERRELTENLLQLFDSGDLLDLEWGLWHVFPKLQHPTIGDQLRPFINDIQKNVVVRRVAINIAQTCKVASLEPELVSLALSRTDVHELRVCAAFAISQFGGPAARHQVSALVTDTSGDDPDDDLKGCGLFCGWPQSLTATQLFNTLTGRKIPNRAGFYDSFLRRDIVSELALDDLATGLAWTERELNCNDSLDPFSRIADEIRAAALGYVSREDVGVALACSTWAWLKANAIFPCPNDKFKTAIREDDSSRRQLISRLIPLGLNDTSFVFYVCQVLISPTDFRWLLARFGEDDREDVRALWRNLIQRIFNAQSDEHRIQLATASSSNPELQNLFEWFLDPNSAAAAEVRRQREEWERASPQIATRPPLDPPPDERVRNSLLQIESGELRRFIDLSANLSLHPDSVSYQPHERARLSITGMPGWINSDDGNKARIVRAAKAYLSDYVPVDSQNWIDTNSCPCELLVGFQALILLLEKDAAFLDNLSIQCWSRWATLPLVRRFSVEKERETCSQLLGIAYRKAPISILEGLRRLIRKENGLQGMVDVLENVDPVLDTEIEAELEATLLQPDLAANSFGDIIGVLLKRGVASALDIANGTLEHIPAEGEQRNRAESVARALILFLPDAGWSILWPIAQQDRQFMVDILASVNRPFELKQSLLANKLSEDQIADLYIWLAEQIPYSEETFENGLGFAAVGPGQSLRWLRDSLLERLKQRATGSCAAFRRVAGSLPQYSFLRWHLAEAEQIARAVWWKPISPDQLFKLTSNRDKRLVQSGAELLDVLLQSLRRLETAMQGETPFSHVVWNEQDGKYRPKNEGRLSDVIKLHFEQDLKARGIVVNREVEIRKGTGRTAGEETDIHVDAVALNPDGGCDRISAIIETKGCWNREVRPAIEAQLVDRYLKENACPYGLYLVGWFVCTQWDREDYRWGDTLKMTLGEAREYFADEARRLSTGGRSVKSFVLNCALR